MVGAISLSTERYLQHIDVPFRYPVAFTHDVLDPHNPALREILSAAGDKPHRALAYVDSGLSAAHPHLAADLARYATVHADRLDLAAPAQTVPGGEAVKENWQYVHRVLRDLAHYKIDRHSFLLVFGGGAVLDAIGLAAALCHRGVRLIRFPSTTLAQDDAGVGVKNGINLEGMKNFAGAFAPPYAVIDDLALLRTLEPGLVLDGISEAFKVAIIKDAGFFEQLAEQAEGLDGGNWNAVEAAVQRCARLHLDHIRTGGDPFEMGAARPLDFGHWSAHRLESMSSFALRHGQAVAIGIALDSVYAKHRGLLTGRELERILGAFRRAGLPVWDDLLLQKGPDGRLDVLLGLDQFREHLGGQLTVTLPQGIGRRIEVHEVDTDLVSECVQELQAWSCRLQR